MVAVLKPIPRITKQIIDVPEWDNRNIESEALWTRANLDALDEYFYDLYPNGTVEQKVRFRGEKYQDACVAVAAEEEEQEQLRWDEEYDRGRSL